MKKTEQVKCPWPLVAVHWQDAFDGSNGWTEVKSYEPSAATVVTVGWLWEGCLHGYITVVNSYMPDEIFPVEDMKTVGMPVHIPVGMVLNVYMLEQPLVTLQSEDPEESPVSQTPHEPSSGHRPFQGRPLDVSNLPPERRELFRSDI